MPEQSFCRNSDLFRPFAISAILCCTLLNAACGALSSQLNSSEAEKVVTAPVAVALPAGENSSEAAMRFLENRVRKDPDDFIAQNKLCGYYLQRLRDTGNVTWLELAKKTAQASLKAIPAEQNPVGLILLAQSQFAAHEFAAARDTARQLLQMNLPGSIHRSTPYQLLSDSLLELGEYDEAEKVRQEMKRLGAGSLSVETRLAHAETLRGNLESARQHYLTALHAAMAEVPPARETVAWIYWQLGELSFAAGNIEQAEKYYRDSLTTYPDYFRAVASMGKVFASRSNFPAAIEQYERVTRMIPEPAFIAALGDLYQLTGKPGEAATQYKLLEGINRISAANGELYNRQMALFYADHDLKTEDAYQMAVAEYSVRRDIYGADALAWTALKAGRISEAQTAMKEALRLGTKDVRLWYHAGMIARAAGDQAEAKKFLQQALKLSPHFDPLQSVAAEKALAE
jgi:tetratricopeptide (TPR) repeat protein